MTLVTSLDKKNAADHNQRYALKILVDRFYFIQMSAEIFSALCKELSGCFAVWCWRDLVRMVIFYRWAWFVVHFHKYHSMTFKKLSFCLQTRQGSVGHRLPYVRKHFCSWQMFQLFTTSSVVTVQQAPYNHFLSVCFVFFLIAFWTQPSTSTPFGLCCNVLVATGCSMLWRVVAR